MPASITWDGSDRGWGIAAYRLERSVDGGAWQRILNRKTKHLDVALATGHTYRYRVRAVDKAGHRSAWADGTDIPTEGRRRCLDLDHLPRLVDGHGRRSAVGGALHEAAAASATATFRFTGRDVAWIAERGPGHGKAKVYVDGSLAGTIDLAATSDLARRVVFKRHFATRDAHVVRIVILGTAGRPAVDVDGFLVLR